MFEKRTKELDWFEEKQMRNLGNFDSSMELFLKKQPLFDGYEKFLECMQQKYPLEKQGVL